MNLTVTLLIAIIILFALIYITAHHCRKLQAENRELEEALEKQKATIAELLRHAEEIALIRSDKGKVENAIKEAETDDELVAIANAIVDANNGKLRK